jgi:hypothetical protein
MMTPGGCPDVSAMGEVQNLALLSFHFQTPDGFLLSRALRTVNITASRSRVVSAVVAVIG